MSERARSARGGQARGSGRARGHGFGRGRSTDGNGAGDSNDNWRAMLELGSHYATHLQLNVGIRCLGDSP